MSQALVRLLVVDIILFVDFVGFCFINSYVDCLVASSFTACFEVQEANVEGVNASWYRLIFIIICLQTHSYKYISLLFNCFFFCATVNILLCIAPLVPNTATVKVVWSKMDDVVKFVAVTNDFCEIWNKLALH